MSVSSLNLRVLVSGVLVGKLVRNGPGKVVFRPSATWLQQGGLPYLSLAFQRPHGQHVSEDEQEARGFKSSETGIPRFFEHLLPSLGGELRKRLVEQHRLQRTSSLRLLQILGHDLPGAVEVVGHPDEEPEAPTEAWAQRITFSLAGMQLKFSMSWLNQRLVLAGRGHEGQWLVKFPGEAFPLLPEVELATMRWAALMGLEVPECRRVGPDELAVPPQLLAGPVRSALAVRRFDRPSPGRRIHQEDFAQALDLDATDTDIYGGPQGRPRVSYEGCTRLVSDVAGAEARDSFIERLAFMVASGNTDAHLKNWSFQWREQGFRPSLSPCYDQVCTIAFPRFGWSAGKSPELALPLAGTSSLEKLDRARILRFAERVRYSGAEALFISALERARKSFLELDVPCPDPMHQALQEHWSSVPLLKSLGGFP